MIFLKTNKKMTIVLIVLSIALLSSIIMYVKFRMDNDMRVIEACEEYEVTPNGTKIVAYTSIPKKVINSAKEYIKNNGYNSEHITFYFLNSCETYHPDYSSKDKELVYYIKETYKDINVGGCFAIDKKGTIIMSQGLMTQSELLKIKTDPDIGATAAVEIARDCLDLESNVPATEITKWLICRPSDSELIFCYKIVFGDNPENIYINGLTGEEVNL